MTKKKEQIENLERLEIMEEKFGVVLQGLNAEMSYFDDDEYMPNLNIYGEIHAANGTGIDQDIEIMVTAFDQDGKVIGNSSECIEKDDFFVLQAIDIMISDISSKPAKIRIYPKKY